MVSVFDFFAPMWVELSFLVFFALGFTFLRLENVRRPSAHKQKDKRVEDCQAKLRKQIEADISTGHNRGAIQAWRNVRDQGPTQVETLKIVVQALALSEPQALTEVVDHIVAHPTVLACPRVATAVLDIVARTGHTRIMEDLALSFRHKLHIPTTPQMYEVLLGGFASVGEVHKIDALRKELVSVGQTLTARGYSLIIKGFLKNGLADSSLQCITEMCQAGFYVPSFAVTQLFRVASDAGRTQEIFERAHDSGIFEGPKASTSLPAEAVAVLLDDCCKRNDLKLARRIEVLAKEVGSPLLTSSFDSLLKIYAVAGDPQALTVFQEMRSSSTRISEGLCVGLLARAADSKFLRFAEEVVSFARERDGMSIVVYSALMKVYAYSGLYDKACDLYDQIKADGLEPDSMMYGCLMKFAAECGRSEFSRFLADKAPTLDVQNYMSLIRAAGRDKDVNRAFAVLQRLQDTGVVLDLPAYNCVLDVCVCVGDLKRAKSLIEQMKGACSIDIITYNTLLKGLCNAGDISGAKAWLQEMEQSGHPPNDVSYNCLINAAISTGRFNDAWEIVTMMQEKHVPVDHYTVSIMMKSLKKAKNPKQVVKTLELLDSSGLEVCSDEVLLNTVLETCIWHKQYPRLKRVLQAFTESGLRPSVPTYGSLIKASSALGEVDKCWFLWRQIVDERGMDPSDIVLGCMLDALVCNDCLEAAVDLLNHWKTRVQPNTVMYSTIIKGFALSRQAARAMEMWREMLQLNIPMNTVAYNALIDAQARVGAMDDVEILVKSMEPNGCTPDVITFSTIVKGYCVKGELHRALEVFQNIDHNGMVADAIIYNTILDGCIRHNNMQLADELVGHMASYNITPSNFTLGILVKMYGRRGQLDKAFEIAVSLPKQFNFTPNSQVRTCLMCACVNNRALSRAFDVFEDMKRSRDGVDVKAYGALLSGCVRHGHLKEAVHLVEEAYGLKGGVRKLARGENLESERLEQLLRSLSQQGLGDEIGVPLVEGLRANNVAIGGSMLKAMQTGRSGTTGRHR